MKTPRILIAVAFMLLFVSFFPGQSQVRSVENEAIATQQKTDLKKDSSLTLKKATSEDLYALDSEMAEKLTALKYDPSTKQSKVSYAFDNTGSVAKVVLYYKSNRLIRVEKRIYDQSNTQTSYSMFNFDEKNGCFFNSQWSLKIIKTRILTMSEYGLIYFNGDMNLIELDSIQMQKLVQETKDSLDALMGHFNGFKYTFEIK
ncbi:MAG: hypothetical protein M0P26_05500 [Bacteroidales bacterium]|nr:hypothetical protein [Bacteroidales bacterium]